MSVTPAELREFANRRFVRTKKDSIRDIHRKMLLAAAAEIERLQADLTECIATSVTLIESLGKKLHAAERSAEQGAAPRLTKQHGRLPILHTST